MAKDGSQPAVAVERDSISSRSCKPLKWYKTLRAAKVLRAQANPNWFAAQRPDYATYDFETPTRYDRIEFFAFFLAIVFFYVSRLGVQVGEVGPRVKSDSQRAVHVAQTFFGA